MLTRRDFIASSAALTGAALVGSAASAAPFLYRKSDRLKLGVIGCGGRGTGAAANSLAAHPELQLVALADVFADRLGESRSNLLGVDAERGKVDDSRCYVGFDAYQKLLASDVDVVILATPPHFRPIHFAAAVAAGKHVFMEKPVAVDPAGVRVVLKAAADAKTKRLSVVAGTQRRHEQSYLQTLARVTDGAIGTIVAGRCSWNQGGLWMHKRQAQWTDMEWQLRNWLYFTWLSGDHITEQHVHNLDVMNWAIGATPLRCVGVGGRQVRTSTDYGHVFDHFAIEYEYPGGVLVTSMCRQQDGTDSRVDEFLIGSKGRCHTRPGYGSITGTNEWKFTGENRNPYEQEHTDLYASIINNEGRNEAIGVAHSTLTAIMGRMAAYTGKEVTWEFALDQSKLDLAPEQYAFGPLTLPEVPKPGQTVLI